MMWLGGTPLPVIGSLAIPGNSKPTKEDEENAKWAASLHFQTGSWFEILIPLHIGAVGYHMMMNKDPLSRMLPPIANVMLKDMDVMLKTRPGAVIGAAAFAGVSAWWLALVAKEYMLTPGEIVLAGAAAPGDTPRRISIDELEQHKTDDDLWIAIDGLVYDVTSYFKMHPAPAGPAVIQKNAGSDASSGFRSAKHSPKAMELR